MSLLISQQPHWQTILRQQQVANAERWLALLQNSGGSQQLIQENYDNLLRALEFSLQTEQTFTLAVGLIQSLHDVVMGYADWERWLHYLESALHTAQRLDDESIHAYLLEQSADVVFQMGQLAQADALYQRAGQIYERRQQAGDHARILIKLAPILSSRGQTETAVSFCKQAYSLAQAIDNQWLMASASLNLSHIHYSAQQWQAGLDAAQRAYTFYQQQNRLEATAKALSNMITGWARLQAWEKVTGASADLLALLTELGDIHTLAVLKTNLGVIAYEQANHQAAEQAWQGALQLTLQMQADSLLAILYNNLGKLYTDMAEWAEANRMLQQAIGFYDKWGDRYNWANSMDNLADLYEAQGEMALYKETLQTAVSALESLPNHTPHSSALLQTMRQRLKMA